jgi:hypothetical protein
LSVIRLAAAFRFRGAHFVSALVASSLLLSGCPAFYVERGEVIAPSASLARPTAATLPAAKTFVDRRALWQREVRIGLGGYVLATLIDPSLAAAQIAHDAAIEDTRGAALDGLIANRWTALYGANRDRFPIDLDWRFDAQFVTNDRVLDPASWAIALKTGTGETVSPMATTIVAASSAPREGYWEGTVRLWFPWRDVVTGTPLLGGQNASVALSLRHPSGSGTATWRFRSGY